MDDAGRRLREQRFVPPDVGGSQPVHCEHRDRPERVVVAEARREQASVRVGDWMALDVVRLPAVGPGQPRQISLPVRAHPAGITSVAAGAGAIWATVPDDHAVWRIDPQTNQTARIGIGYYPWGVAVGDDGIWVAVRARET